MLSKRWKGLMVKLVSVLFAQDSAAFEESLGRSKLEEAIEGWKGESKLASSLCAGDSASSTGPEEKVKSKTYKCPTPPSLCLIKMDIIIYDIP